jgi:hypothetical protein
VIFLTPSILASVCVSAHEIDFGKKSHKTFLPDEVTTYFYHACQPDEIEDKWILMDVPHIRRLMIIEV